MLPLSWKPLRFHPIQSELWRTNKRFVGVAAGRGSGKTELARRRVVRFLPVKKPWLDPMYFYALPTRQQAKRTAWLAIKQLVPKEWIKGKPYETDMMIETVFGSFLYVVGMDKPQRIEGNQWDGGVIDESSDQKPSAFRLSILPALSHRNGWCWRIGVPKRQGVGALDFRQFCEKSDSEFAFFSWPSSDILTPEQLRFAQENLDAKDYAEQYEASFQDISGLIFYAFSVANISSDVSYNPDYPIVVGSDFNVDPMAWIVAHIVDNKLYVFDELFLRNTNTQATLNNLFARYGQHSAGWEFYGDATGKARKTAANDTDLIQIKNDKRFINKKIFYLKSNPPQQTRFAETNALLRNAAGEIRCYISSKCKNLLTDLQSRQYIEGSTEPNDIGDLGHITDALGYVIHRRWPIRVNRIMTTDDIFMSI